MVWLELGVTDSAKREPGTMAIIHFDRELVEHRNSLTRSRHPGGSLHKAEAPDEFHIPSPIPVLRNKCVSDSTDLVGGLYKHRGKHKPRYLLS